jgi:hypothetical protein
MTRSGRERANQVAGARLVVADGALLTVAAAAAGVGSGDTVARRVARLNTEVCIPRNGATGQPCHRI